MNKKARKAKDSKSSATYTSKQEWAPQFLMRLVLTERDDEVQMRLYRHWERAVRPLQRPS